MKMSLNLHLFEGGHSVTLHKDAGVTTFTADESSDVQKDAEVTLTVALKTGYEVAEYEVIAGGVEVNAATKKFTMGEEDVVIYLKTKSGNLYKVTEECSICVNGKKTVFHQNTHVVLTKNGVPKDIVVESGGEAITVNDAVQSLIDQGILVKI